MVKIGDTIPYTDSRIEWDEHQISDQLDGLKWVEYEIHGKDNEGIIYYGYCQDYGYEPNFDKFTEVEITDIFEEET